MLLRRTTIGSARQMARPRHDWMNGVDEQVMLMRHAPHDRGALTEEGKNGVRDVAVRLAEWLEGRDALVVAEWTGGPEAEATALELVLWTKAELRRLGDRDERVVFARDDRDGLTLAEDVRTSTVELGAYRPDARKFCEIRGRLEQVAFTDDAEVPLLVGNDPLIGWLAGDFAGSEIPVRRGELLFLRRKWRFRWFWQKWPRHCLRRRWRVGCLGWCPRWDLGWTISPVDDVSAITPKIESKMNTAKALGAVITALMVFVLTDALRSTPSVWDWLALAAFATSTAGYFGALFVYDTLLMPPGFWAGRFPPDRREEPDDGSRSSQPDERPGVRATYRAIKGRLRHGRTGIERPPSPNDRVLQEAMVTVWNSLFRPATLLVGVGLLLLAVGATGESGETRSDRGGWVFVARSAADDGSPSGQDSWAVVARNAAEESTGSPSSAGWWIVVLVSVIWAAAVACWISASRPQLGVSD
jgi:hypothetical protein